MQGAIRALVDGDGISPDAAAAAMETIMNGEATPGQVGAFLVAMRQHGETAEVIAACLRVMQAHAEPVPVHDVVDLCGTGGDGADTFNVSTAAGFVVAASGVRVAKHGNRAASSKCGSADLLEAMGARLDLTGAQAARVIEDCGFCFIFAQRFHPAMRHVGAVRREIGIRTVFNIIGPLSNPANPRAQLVGVGTKALGPLVAQVLALRGIPRAMVVHSADGLDEISPMGSSTAWLVDKGVVTERILRPTDFGVPEHPLKAVAGGDAAQNKATLISVMNGEKTPVADFVVMNAAAALHVAGAATDFKTGTMMARQAIDTGRARQVMEQYIALTNEVAGA